MSPLIITIVGAVIAAAATIIAALIQRSKKSEDANNSQEQNTNTGVVQNLTVNVNIGDKDTPLGQKSMVMDNNRVTSVRQRRRKNPFLPNQDEIKSADINDPHYFEKIATYLAENRSLDEIKIKGNKE